MPAVGASTLPPAAGAAPNLPLKPQQLGNCVDAGPLRKLVKVSKQRL